MHTDSSSDDNSPSPSALPVPASELPGVSFVRPALSLWQRVDALRELLQQGALLLGEVVTLTRNAEESLATAAAEKAMNEKCRHRLEEEHIQLRLETHQLSTELEKKRNALAALQLSAEQSRSVSESSSLRVSELQAEITHLRSQPAAPSSAPHDALLISDLKKRLQQMETQLQQSRATLASERERRNRAISLIKPLSAESTSLQSSQAT